MKTICLDFDGVVHSYTSGWVGPRTIPDPPVPGAFDFIYKAVSNYDVAIYSSRSRYWGGRAAMRGWFRRYGLEVGPLEDGLMIKGRLLFPRHKPPATVYVDDRGYRFTGQWPEPTELVTMAPWNKEDSICQ